MPDYRYSYRFNYSYIIHLIATVQKNFSFFANAGFKDLLGISLPDRNQALGRNCAEAIVELGLMFGSLLNLL